MNQLSRAAGAFLTAAALSLAPRAMATAPTQAVTAPPATAPAPAPGPRPAATPAPAKDAKAKPAAKKNNGGKKKKKPKKAPPSPPPVPQAAVVIDGATGAILACDKCNEPRAPASMLKLVTAMVGFDALKAGTIRLEDMVPLLEAQTAMNNGAITLYQRGGVKPGTPITIDTVLSAVAVTSAADATITLSKAICGTETCITTSMNNKVAKILNNPKAVTHFVNSHGMPAKGQLTTAYEMALVMRHMMTAYPKEQWGYFAKTSYTVNGVTIKGHNRLLVDYKCKNALGLPYNCMEAGKTGFFLWPKKDQGPAAGFCLAGSAVWDGYRVVAVRMGDLSPGGRNDRMKTLFDTGFKALGESKAPKTVAMPLHFPDLFKDKVEQESAQTHTSQPVLAP